MKRKPLIITLSLACTLTLCGGVFTACGGDRKIDVIESDDGYEWKYNQAFADETDADMKIDGKLNESRWTDKNWLTHREQNVEMRYTTSFSEKGLYIAAEAKDARMQWNDTRAFMNNSSFFFYVISNEATEYHAFDCLGFYVDELHSACRQQTRFSAKANRTEEGGTPTLTAEFFASWEALNYEVNEETGMPDEVRFIPAYRYVVGVGSQENTFLKPALAELGGNKVRNAYAFDGDGYINVDVEGADLGNGNNGFAKSDGWDLSNVKGGENGVGKSIKSSLYGDQAIFFKGIESSRYSYSVDIKYDRKIVGTFPAAGVLDMKSATDFNIMRFHGDDFTNSGKKEFRYFLLDFHSNRSDKQYGYYKAGTGSDTVNVRVIKDDTRYYYIFNGVYEFSVDLDWLGGKTVPGFYTFDAEVEFADWEVTDYEGAGKDEAFNALCAQYMDTVKLSSDVSGGTITADKLAVAAGSGETVKLFVTPSRGYMLTDFTVNGTSEYDTVVAELQNGVYELTPQGTTQIGATFSALPAASTIRLTGTVKSSSGRVHIGLPYSVKSSEQANENLLYNYGATTSAGLFDITLLKAGTYTIGGRTVVCDGKYTLGFEGIFPRGEASSFTIDTTDDKFGGSYYNWGEVVVNPLKVSQMTENADGEIQTTHTTYQSVVFSYYLENNTVTGSFQLDMTVNASNDKWPCYGLTIEDENNNSVQFFAAGVNVYRIMSSYDGVNYKQVENKPATYKDGVSVQRLVYNENTDEFKFYVNGVLFDTVKRSDYLTGSTFRYGPVGYMSGADGSNSAVTEDNPFATFTKPVETKEFTLTLPNGATLKTSDGTVIADGKVPILSTVTVTIPFTDGFNYTVYVDGVPVETEMKDGNAVATFEVSAHSTVTYKRAYSVGGSVAIGSSYEALAASEKLEDAVVMAAGENGEVVAIAKANDAGAFTLVLPEGIFFVAAKGINLISDAVQITVEERGIDIDLQLELDKPAISEQLFETQLDYDVKTGNYHMNGVHGQKAGGYLAGANASGAYVASVTMSDLGEDWPSGGFIVGTSSSKYVKFEIVKATESRKTYILRIKDAVTNGEALWWFDDVEEFKQYNSLTEFDFKVVHSGEMYYVFLGNNLLVSVSEELTIGSTTIKAAVGKGDAKIGLYGEEVITFGDWNYSFDAAVIKALIGRTVTFADGMTATAGGKPITNGEVLLGDKVEVTIDVPAGQHYNILVDGNAVETKNENGKATATFTVTGNNEVTYAVAYRATGTVAGGDENTVITIATENGQIVYTGTGASFETTLSNGKYVVTAQGTDKVSGGVKFTVNGAAQDDLNVEMQLPKLLPQGIPNGWGVDTGAFTYDPATGKYFGEQGTFYTGKIANVSAQKGSAWAVSATVNILSESAWPSAGILLMGGTPATQNVKFEILRNTDANVYWLRVRDLASGSDNKTTFQIIHNTDNNAWLRDNQAKLQGDVKLTLVSNRSEYYLFIGEEMVLAVTGDDASKVTRALGEGNISVGFYCEHNVMFSDWSFASDYDEMYGYIGKTLTATDFEVRVNGVAATDNKVLFGDSVTVSMSISAGQSVSILVDGKAVETNIADGKATATFTVTGNHTVTYTLAYVVSGSVTGGDENTVITITPEGGSTPVYTGKGTSFETTLANGAYVVTAQGSDKVSGGVKFTVENGGVSDIVVALDRLKLTETIKNEWAEIAYDAASGTYRVYSDISYNNGGYFGSVTAGETFVLKATIGEFTGQYPSAGFAVQTAGGCVRFALRWRPEGDWQCYDSLSWNTAGVNTDRGRIETNPFVNGSAEIALVYNHGTYYFFAGDTLLFSESGYDAANGKVGLFCERNITYTDWSYSAERDDASSFIGGKTVTATGMKIAVNGTAVTNGAALLGDKVTVSVSVAAGQNVSILVDGKAIETNIADGKATATFTVTGNHTVTHDVSFSVSGTVTGGDENSTIIMVNEAGDRVFTGSGTSFSVNLPNGVYYASAKTDAKMSNGEKITVENAAVSNIVLNIDQPKINHYAFINQWGGWTHNMITENTYEDGKGVYHIPNHDYWAGVFDGGTFAKTADYVVKADCNIVLDTPNGGTVAGLALYSTNADDANNVKFEIVYDGGSYFLRVRGNNNGGFNKTYNSDNNDWVKNNQDVLKHNVTLAVVHKDNGYYVFINGTLVLSLTGQDATDIDNHIGTENVQVGVYAEFEATYAEWSYSSDVSGYTLPNA